MNPPIVDFEDSSGADGVPAAETITGWVQHTLKDRLDKNSTAQLSIQVVNVDYITELNETYRHKSGPTNVLSFPFEAPPGLPAEEADGLLGDIIICAQVVAKEAEEQHKSLQSHWAHMVVHGVLHLLGYDHVDDNDAEEMESLEVQLLSKLAFPNPYQQR